MNLLVSNKIVCSMGLFEGPGNEGEEFHQMFAICDEIVKILPTWDLFLKDSNEKLDIKVKSRFEWDFFPWGAFLIEEKCFSFHCFFISLQYVMKVWKLKMTFFSLSKKYNT